MAAPARVIRTPAPISWADGRSASRWRIGASAVGAPAVHFRTDAARIAPCPDVLRRPASRSGQSPACHRLPHPSPESMVDVKGCRSRSAGLGRPRPSGARHALRPHLHGRGKTAGAIPRGEFLACDPWCLDDPRRISAPGMCRPRASVLARERAKREYERRSFSGSRKRASDGQGRHCVGSRRCSQQIDPVERDRVPMPTCPGGRRRGGLCGGLRALPALLSSRRPAPARSWLRAVPAARF